MDFLDFSADYKSTLDGSFRWSFNNPTLSLTPKTLEEDTQEPTNGASFLFMPLTSFVINAVTC
jgi:hypothetical protein